jgi:hypothetical protein
MVRPYAVLLALLALAGCSSVEASTPPQTALATPSLPCSLPYGAQVTLVSPKSGSHEVSRSASLVTDARHGARAGGPLEPVARPANAPRPPFANAVYYRAPGVTLHAHQQYTVAVDDLAQNGCAPYAQISGNPHFST